MGPPALFAVVLGVTPALVASLTLYRSEGPICDRVLMGLEAKGVDYATAALEAGAGDVPRVAWDDGSESEAKTGLPILERLEKDWKGVGAELFQRPRAGIDRVRDTNMRFKPIFPRNCAPRVDAPFLFRADGSLAPRDAVVVTLEETDELLEENEEGDFFAGAGFSAADCAWGPFLFRFAVQVPLLYEGVFPRSSEYPALHRWFDAVEDLLPAWKAKVRRDAPAWRDALEPHAPLVATLDDVRREAEKAEVRLDPWTARSSGATGGSEEDQVADYRLF